MSAVPAGFELIPAFGQFHEMCGPMYAKKSDNGFIIGIQLGDKHGNKGSNLHGGMLAMLIDTAFTYTSRHSRNPPKPSVTINLSIDMMSVAKPGDWLEAHVDVARMGRTTTFLNCFVMKGTERIARGSGVFMVVDRPMPAGA
jgi:uncharacterized protein (TIGR00369 family)